jgi:thymidine phosphorylase
MPLAAGESGYVAKIDGRALGLAVVRLGGGRQREGDRVDPAVGLSDVAALGDYVERGEQLALVHARTARAAEEAAAALGPAFTIAAREPELPPTVYRRLG